MKNLIPAILILLLQGISPDLRAQKARNSKPELLKQKTEQEIRELIEESPALTGLAAVDLSSGETFSFNAGMVFPQASAIKIPILMEVYKQAHEGKFALSNLREVSPRVTVGGSGILRSMEDPVSLSIRNLCVLMICLSDNTATNSLIDLVGMEAVNKTMASLGLEHTRLRRKMMDTAASGRGEENTSTPAEAASVLQILHEGKFINETLSEEILSVLKKNGRANSRLAAGVPAPVPVAFKPGGLNGVSTEWTIIFLPERPYAVAAMENYQVKGRSEDLMEKASEILYQFFWRLGNATPYGSYVDPELIR